MGARTKLDITTERLADAAGKASATLAGSAISGITAPPPTATSQLDAALALLATSAEARRVNVDATDSTRATRQQAALTQSPPVLVQQDQQGAADMNGPAAQFPTPAITPGVTGKIYYI